MIYIMTPLTNDRQKDMATAEKFCRSSSFTEMSISPMLAFSYRDYEDDWRMQYYSEKLMDHCESVRVFCDEVTEMMIHMIKYAATKKLPIEFYDASGNHINYDALIINKRIGPGYRKMIVMSHGDLPASGVCPHCGSSLMTEAK